jgi:hypothetical protein
VLKYFLITNLAATAKFPKIMKMKMKEQNIYQVSTTSNSKHLFLSLFKKYVISYALRYEEKIVYKEKRRGVEREAPNKGEEGIR